jgi:polysaccharide biosynthesis protein PslG
VSGTHERLRRANALCVACLSLWSAGAFAQAGGASFIVGIGRSIHDPPAATAAIGGLGVKSERLDAPWASIEVARGRYEIPAWLETAVDSAREHGIEPLLILEYGHPLYDTDKPRSEPAIAGFAAYAAFVVKHFAGRVRLFDLWNEWDAHTGRTTPGSADDYVALARRVYPALKAANPDAVVLSGGITSFGLSQGFMERFVELGGMAFVDGLSLHPYNFDRQSGNTPEAALAEVDRVYALVARAGRAPPIYVTELGYPTFTGRGGVAEDTAAAYLARFVLLASSRPYVAGVWWYCLRDQGTDRANKEHNFGVLDSALHAKPAADALRAASQLLGAVGRFRDAGATDGRRVTATVADGTQISVAWREGDTRAPAIADLAAAAALATQHAQGRR